MNYRERIRKAIACPQFGDKAYGEWGMLNLTQRKYIKRLLDELDRADNYFKSVYLENQELKEKVKKLSQWDNNKDSRNSRQRVANAKLIKENQELKQKYENAVSDYETTMFEKEQLNSLVNSCQEEIRKLKKQLEELKSTNKVLSEKLTKDKILKQDCLTTCCGIPIGDIPKLINQQKKFIKYLEDEFTKIQNDIEKEIDNNVKYFKVERRQAIAKILQKYKSIIGDDK